MVIGNEKRDVDIQNVDRVVIVGGGTAGWIAALSLNTYCPDKKIVLIQPKNGKVIGVGESTQPDLLDLLDQAGIDQVEFMKATDATFKCGIYYEDWNEIGKNYWHPFTSMTHAGTYTPAHHYQQMIRKNPEKYTHEGYYDAVHPSYGVCVKNNKVDPQSGVALHVDADKMHMYLRHKLVNVDVLEPETIEIFSDDGYIAHIKCDDMNVAADLFVDCTGFNQLLMKEIGNTEVEYYHENVESAIFARIPYEDRNKEMAPYTKAHAQKHGWIWTIPLFSRIGSGYVYTKNSCTAEEAEAEFRAYWGEERLKDVPLKHMEFKSETLKNSWVSNVVAIGLSGGFVEPLEATGISWLVNSSKVLCNLLSRCGYGNNTRTLYNATLRNYIEDVQDFVDVHYKLSARRDTVMWQYHTFRGHHPRLINRLEIYKKNMPSKWNRPTNVAWAFNEISWIDILNGYKFEFDEQPDVPQEIVDGIEKEMRRQRLLREGREEKCMTNLELLEEIYDLCETPKLEKLPTQ